MNNTYKVFSEYFCTIEIFVNTDKKFKIDSKQMSNLWDGTAMMMSYYLSPIITCVCNPILFMEICLADHKNVSYVMLILIKVINKFYTNMKINNNRQALNYYHKMCLFPHPLLE